jgi:hypothetical protein
LSPGRFADAASPSLLQQGLKVGGFAVGTFFGNTILEEEKGTTLDPSILWRLCFLGGINLLPCAAPGT